MIFLFLPESRDDQRKDEEEMLWKVDGIEYVLDKVEHLVKNAKKVCSFKFGMRISRIHY